MQPLKFAWSCATDGSAPCVALQHRSSISGSIFLSQPFCTFRIMDLGSVTEDQLDRIIAQSEREIAGWRVVEIVAIPEKKSRQSHTVDGCIGKASNSSESASPE